MAATVASIVGSMALSLVACGSASAASSPVGIWIDHTGRGAVEITECGGKLCGHLVWFKDEKHSKGGGCNFQVIGNVRPVAGNKWDGGWIIDPDKDPNKKYDVEIRPLSDQKLKVMGYSGMKFLSETMTWTRAPTDLKKCGDDASTPAPDPAPKSTSGDTVKPERDTGKGTTARQPTQETDCKKYFPQTGGMVSVPCEKKR